MRRFVFSLFFFFNDTATTEIYTLSLHDALPISQDPPAAASHSASSSLDRLSSARAPPAPPWRRGCSRHVSRVPRRHIHVSPDRKSTRLNSSHGYISYAVFCLKKKKTVESRIHHH